MATTEVTDTVNAGLVKIIGDSQTQLSSDQLLATAVPQGVDAGDLAAEDRWSTITLDYAGKWSSGSETRAVVKVAFSHSARHQSGGAFIPSLYAWVESLDVDEKAKLNVSLTASAPYVVGDTAPIAALPVAFELTETGPDGDNVDGAEESKQFVLYGNGYIEQL